MRQQQFEIINHLNDLRFLIAASANILFRNAWNCKKFCIAQ